MWRWIWLATAVLAIGGEMLTPGVFFLLPFGVGAALACVLAFAGAPVLLQFVAFLAVAVAGVAATRPLARRIDRNTPAAAAGARRLIGRTATVVGAIPEGEEWRAVTHHGVPIPAGSRVLVTEVVGTRLEVLPLELAEEGEA